MKHQEDHSVVTHWGGRAERYRDFPRTEVRAHDSFGVQPVQFGHAFHFEGWVLERFAPTTETITPRPTMVSAVIKGVERRAKATFVVTRRDGAVEYFFLTKSDAPTAEMLMLRRIAAVNGATVVHLTRSEVRARVDDFWFWELLRQVATVWVREGAELDNVLVAQVAGGPKPLSDLCGALGKDRDLIRARLARLHVAGRLVITRSGRDLIATLPYGGPQ